MATTKRVPESFEPPPDDESVATLDLNEPTEDEAWAQGWWAYGFAKEKDANPYDLHTKRRAWAWWREGWEFAQENDGG